MLLLCIEDNDFDMAGQLLLTRILVSRRESLKYIKNCNIHTQN